MNGLTSLKTGLPTKVCKLLRSAILKIRESVTLKCLTFVNTASNDHYDVFKDSILRYLGYANEVGEAFRSVVHVRWVWLSYGVASSYVFADAVDKGWKEMKHGSSGQQQYIPAIKAFTDTLIWQGLASVIVPGFTINRICYLTGGLLQRASSLPLPVRRWGTTAVGLGCIPFIISPIDHGVHVVMDHTVRVWYNHHPKRIGEKD